MKTWFGQNEEELISIGQKLGRLLDSGDMVFTLRWSPGGWLKTTLTRGLPKVWIFLNDQESPTYATIVGSMRAKLPLYHLDVYLRIGDDPDSIDLDDFLYGERCDNHRAGWGSRRVC